MSTHATRSAAVGVLVATAGICYSSWVVGLFLTIPLDPLRTFLSELAADGRPYREIFVVGDITTGCLAVGSALLALVLRPRLTRGAVATLAMIAFACFGMATIADALAPISCVPGVDAGCEQAATGFLPQLHQVHALTSTLAVFGIFTAMIAGSVTALRRRQWHLLRGAGTALTVVALATTVWMLVADNVSGDLLLGLAQRIEVGAMSLWMILWGVAIAFERHTPGSSDRHDPPDHALRSTTPSDRPES